MTCHYQINTIGNLFSLLFLLLIITMSHAVIMTTLRADTSVTPAVRCFDSAQYRNWIQERCSSYILWSFRSYGMWRWNCSVRRFERSQARISLKRARGQRVSIYIGTLHMYWPNLVKFGLGDCQIISLSSLIVSFMKIGRQKAELHAWVCLKSRHIFNVFVTIRIKFCIGDVHEIFWHLMSFI